MKRNWKYTLLLLKKHVSDLFIHKAPQCTFFLHLTWSPCLHCSFPFALAYFQESLGSVCAETHWTVNKSLQLGLISLASSLDAKKQLNKYWRLNKSAQRTWTVETSLKCPFENKLKNILKSTENENSSSYRRRWFNCDLLSRLYSYHLV